MRPHPAAHPHYQELPNEYFFFPAWRSWRIAHPKSLQRLTHPTFEFSRKKRHWNLKNNILQTNSVTSHLKSVLCHKIMISVWFKWLSKSLKFIFGHEIVKIWVTLIPLISSSRVHDTYSNIYKIWEQLPNFKEPL